MRLTFALITLFLPTGIAAEPPLFSEKVAPILLAKCLSCHSPEKAKGGYQTHTFNALMTAGKSKNPAVIAEQPEQSELFKRIISTDADERMPQSDDPLTPGQVQLFRDWIAAGAKLDRGSPDASIASLVPRTPYPPAPEKYRRPLPIIALAFEPDGDHVAVSGHHEITLWSLSGALVRRLTNLPQRIRSIAFHPAGKAIAVAGGQPGRSGELLILNASSGEAETNLLRASDELLTVAFSPDGKRLACGGTDNAIHLFDFETRERITTIQQHADWVTSLSFNTNGTLVASSSRDRTARIYDTTTGDLEVTYTAQKAALYAAQFLADGHLISGGRDKVLHIWDAKDGKKKGEISGFSGDVSALISTRDRAFAASGDGMVKELSPRDRKVVRALNGHGAAVYSLAFHEPSMKLASGSYDGVVNIWNVEDGSLEKSFVAAPGWSATR